MLPGTRRSPLRPASAAAILGSDWLMYSVSTMFELEMLGRAVVWGSIFCGIVVFLVENVSRPGAALQAAGKGTIAACAVAAPGLVLGTVLGLGVLSWWLYLRLTQRSNQSRQ